MTCKGWVAQQSGWSMCTTRPMVSVQLFLLLIFCFRKQLDPKLTCGPPSCFPVPFFPFLFLFGIYDLSCWPVFWRLRGPPYCLLPCCLSNALVRRQLPASVISHDMAPSSRHRLHGMSAFGGCGPFLFCTTESVRDFTVILPCCACSLFTPPSPKHVCIHDALGQRPRVHIQTYFGQISAYPTSICISI